LNGPGLDRLCQAETATPPLDGVQRSGALHRPIHEIGRPAVDPVDARTELERYKLSLRRYAPVQKGVAGLPWKGAWQCAGCGETVPGQLAYDADEDAIYLETACPSCGAGREHHHDVLFVKERPGRDRPHQPQRTHKGAPIRPVVQELPKTVETLCPECRCVILGRYYVRDDIVWIEKTCPEHGYFRDKINTDVALYLKGTRSGWQDEQGVYEPQVAGAGHCPSDCGLCNQHHSASCLAQIDLSSRCNLNCPVCFASAGSTGRVAEPDYDMVVEYLQALRNQHPYPATAIQFTGGEPTIHPDFLRIVEQANRMGFSHVQIATNGLKLANAEFARQAAAAGLHTLYLQFDGLDDEIYKRTRGVPLLERKLACVENCRQNDIKICLVPTVINNCNRDQVGKIFRFAADNADVISAISYQPVAITGRISQQEREQMRYTLGDLAHDIAEASGADIQRDLFPLSVIAPLSRIMQVIDGQPKIRPSCHGDCAFGTYFFVTPEKEAIPIPQLFDIFQLFGGFNELYFKITGRRADGKANWLDRLAICWTFVKSYNWSQFDRRINPFTFIHALRGMTNKHHGRGEVGRQTYRTLMAAGMHFMDAYNYDVERIKRCVILYSTPDGIYPFCTINGGPEYRPYLERMIARKP
jgi:uncharacterized radical SAM superfamily Fe-S cluster-containing enzyme